MQERVVAQLDKTNPENFTLAKWKDLNSGDSVYLAGTHLGDFRAYGPHIVVDPVKMILKNAKGTEFLQYQEILCKSKENAK